MMKTVFMFDEVVCAFAPAANIATAMKVERTLRLRIVVPSEMIDTVAVRESVMNAGSWEHTRAQYSGEYAQQDEVGTGQAELR